MKACGPNDFKHTTLRECPDEIAGITLLDEEPGFTGIYVRSASGGLWPARTVDRSNARHHDSVVASWLSREGTHVDLRAGATEDNTHGEER